jgi:hypothetical protein
MKDGSKYKPVIYVVCPAGNATGGTELLHQIAVKLIAIGGDVKMVYWPENAEIKVNAAFREYNVPHCEFPTDSNEVVIIFPEIFAQLARPFKNAKVVLWWLSVDNYFFSRDKKRGKFNRWLLTTFDSQKYCFFESYLKRFDMHLFQSHYALDMLIKNKMDNLHRLQDYLHSSFLSEKYDIATKKPIVAYNPKKGGKFTSQLIAKFPSIEFVPIENMSRDQVVDLLRSAMVYLDLGYHPGMDRIPREAGSLGCCVIVNKMGSAAFFDDVPIPSEYKIDTQKDYETQFSNMIPKIFEHFDACHEEFSGYRAFISAQEANFDNDVVSIYSELTS